MSNKQLVDTFVAPLLGELAKLKDRLVNVMDVNEKIKDNQVKLEEKMKVKVARIATLEAENRTLKQQLATQGEVIMVLTDGSNNDRINNRAKDATIRQLEEKVNELTKQLQLSRKNEKSAKRKQTTEVNKMRKQNQELLKCIQQHEARNRDLLGELRSCVKNFYPCVTWKAFESFSYEKIESWDHETISRNLKVFNYNTSQKVNTA